MAIKWKCKTSNLIVDIIFCGVFLSLAHSFLQSQSITAILHHLTANVNYQLLFAHAESVVSILAPQI